MKTTSRIPTEVISTNKVGVNDKVKINAATSETPTVILQFTVINS